MPYYLFKVRQDKSAATLITSLDKFPEASAQAKNLRRNLSVEENCFIKLIYATEPQEGERLVLEDHPPSSPVEEWE